MATRPVRFEFSVEKGDKLKYVHNLPQRLLTAQADAKHVSDFADCVAPIMAEHEAACLAASSTTCGICGAPTARVLQTPMSWLHVAQDPFVHVWVNVVCDKVECEMQTRQQIQDLMTLICSEGAGEEGKDGQAGAANSKPREPESVLRNSPCVVCGKVEGTKKCAACKVVAYCGTDHQKADWKIHKRICAQLAV